MTKTNKTISDITTPILFGVGVIFLISPFLLYQWIHGDYERYLWIISGPDPYSKFGGGPYQLIMYLSLLLTGIILIISAFLLKRKYCNKKDN